MSDIELLCRRLDGFENPYIPRAAAEVSREAFLYLLHCRPRMLLQQCMGCEYHAWGANAALRASTLEKTLLNRVQVFRISHAFYGANACAPCLERGNQATIHELAIEQHRARTTFPFSAAFLGTGKSQILTKHIQQSLHRRHIE
jgi:hypothetical protein